MDEEFITLKSFHNKYLVIDKGSFVKTLTSFLQALLELLEGKNKRYTYTSHTKVKFECVIDIKNLAKE